jgi:DNA-binding GntR family transcriptional regulator
MKSKPRQDQKKGEELRQGTVGRGRPKGPQTGANRSAADSRAALGQEATLASALQIFRLDRHGSYTVQVETALREAIVRGRLSPGTSLSEATISAVLGLSRTPVREALALLADAQLVVIYPQVKTLVAPVRRSLIDEGRFVRSTLECANHAELVTMITQPQIDSLTALIAAQRNAAAAGDVEAFFKLDEAMHRSMFEFAGRAHVWAMLQGVKQHFDRVRWLLLERVAYHARRAQQEHEAIMDRLLARDAAGLTEAVSHHINAISGHMQELHDRSPPTYFVD